MNELPKNYDGISNEILPYFPEDYRFTILSFVEKLPENWWINQPYGEKSECVKVISEFLKEKGFAVPDQSAPAFSLPYVGSDFIKLIAKGIILKGARSYRRFERIERSNSVAENREWNKFWIGLIAGLTISLINSWFTYHISH